MPMCKRAIVDTLLRVATTRASTMRGNDGMQEGLFTLAKLDDFVPAEHPLRAIRTLVNEALGGLNALFNTIYADSGRASIAPEKLLRAMLIQVFYSVRSERQLMEQIRYNLLFRWFIGLAIDDDVWDHSGCSPRTATDCSNTPWWSGSSAKSCAWPSSASC
jgi:transposase